MLTFSPLSPGSPLSPWSQKYTLGKKHKSRFLQDNKILNKRIKQKYLSTGGPGT